MRATSFLILAFAVAPSLADDYRDAILADRPVAYWRFDDALDCCAREENDHRELKAERGDNVSLIAPGPREPEFLAFDRYNLAADFTVVPENAYLRIADPGSHSSLDFTVGDTLTLEVWVAPGPIPVGREPGIITKGGTRGDDVLDENWALRLLGTPQQALPVFLFASSAKGQPQHHRWLPSRGISANGRWHHLVFTHTFGKSDSTRLWIDGVVVDGHWQPGSDGAAAPIVQDGDLWIGNRNGGAAAGQFPGQIDEVALYRAALPQRSITVRSARP